MSLVHFWGEQPPVLTFWAVVCFVIGLVSFAWASNQVSQTCLHNCYPNCEESRSIFFCPACTNYSCAFAATATTNHTVTYTPAHPHDLCLCLGNCDFGHHGYYYPLELLLSIRARCQRVRFSSTFSLSLIVLSQPFLWYTIVSFRILSSGHGVRKMKMAPKEQSLARSRPLRKPRKVKRTVFVDATVGVQDVGYKS